MYIFLGVIYKTDAYEKECLTRTEQRCAKAEERFNLDALRLSLKNVSGNH